MQKTKAKLPVLIIVVTVIVACFLRLFQLLRYTDAQTGLVCENFNISYVIYAVLFAMLSSCLVYGIRSGKRCKVVSCENNDRALCVLSAVSSAGLFVSFLNQSFGCYSYIENTKYIDYPYIITLGASGVFALVSSFYFGIIFVVSRGTNLDLKKLGVFNYSPIIWALLRLVSTTTSFIDIKSGVESSCEFLYLVALIFMWFGYLLSVDADNVKTNMFFTTNGIFFFCLSVILFIPRVVGVLSGSVSISDRTGIDYISYIALGILALVLITDGKHKTENSEK